MCTFFIPYVHGPFRVLTEVIDCSDDTLWIASGCTCSDSPQEALKEEEQLSTRLPQAPYLKMGPIYINEVAQPAQKRFWIFALIDPHSMYSFVRIVTHTLFGQSEQFWKTSLIEMSGCTSEKVAHWSKIYFWPFFRPFSFFKRLQYLN